MKPKKYTDEEIAKQIELCKSIAQEAHKGQTTLIGADYFKAHILPTINVIKGNYEYTKCKDLNIAICAGYLHDVVEDTPITYEELIKMGVWCEVVDVVEILTRNKGTSYKDYIRAIIESGNHTAILVKYADLSVNASTATANHVPDTLRNRYFDALGMLQAYTNSDIVKTMKTELKNAIYARKELEYLLHVMKHSNAHHSLTAKNFCKFENAVRIIPDNYFVWKCANHNETDVVLYKIITQYKVLPESVRNQLIEKAPRKINNLFVEILKEYKKISVLHSSVLHEYAKVYKYV